MKKILLLLPVLFSLNCGASDLIQLFNDKDSQANKKAVNELIYKVTLDRVEADVEALKVALTSAGDDEARLSYLTDYIADYVKTANLNRTEITQGSTLIPLLQKEISGMILWSLRSDGLKNGLSVCREWRRYIQETILKSPKFHNVYIHPDLGLDAGLQRYGWSPELHQVSLQRWGLHDLRPNTPLRLLILNSSPDQVQHLLPGICEAHDVRSVVVRAIPGDFEPFQGACGAEKHSDFYSGFHVTLCTYQSLCSDCKIKQKNKEPMSRRRRLNTAVRGVNQTLPSECRFFINSFGKQFGAVLENNLDLLHDYNRPYIHDDPLGERRYSNLLEAFFQIPLNRLNAFEEGFLSQVFSKIISVREESRFSVARLLTMISSFENEADFSNLLGIIAGFSPVPGQGGEAKLIHLSQLDNFKPLKDSEKIMILRAIQARDLADYTPEVLERIVDLYNFQEDKATFIKYFEMFTRLYSCNLKGYSEASIPGQIGFCDLLLTYKERHVNRYVEGYARSITFMYFGILSCFDSKGTDPKESIKNLLFKFEIHNLNIVIQKRIIQNLKKLKFDSEREQLLGKYLDCTDFTLRNTIFEPVKSESRAIKGPVVLAAPTKSPEEAPVPDAKSFWGAQDKGAVSLKARKSIRVEKVEEAGPRKVSDLHSRVVDQFHQTLSSCFDQETVESTLAVDRFMAHFSTERLNPTSTFLFRVIKSKGDDQAKTDFLNGLVEANPDNLVAALFKK